MGKYKEISFIGLADLIGTAITSIFWLFLASQITPTDYGELFYFIGIAGTVSAFVLIGAQNTITVYSSKNIGIESTLYFISLLFGVVASFVTMFMFYRIDVIFLMFGYVINTLALGELLGTRSFGLYSKHTLLQKILTFGLGLSFLLIFGVDGIIFALSISYVFFILVVYKRFKQTKIDFGLLKNRIRFIVNNYIIEIFTKLNSHLNKLIIVPLLGFEALGNFSLAIQFVTVGLIFTVIVFKYTVPYDVQGIENKKLKKVTVLVSIVIALVGALVSPSVIHLFFPEYLEVINIIKILSFSIIPITIARILSSKLLGQEKNKRILFSKVISLATFVISIVFLAPSYGMTGISIGYLLSTIAECLLLIQRNNSQSYKPVQNNS